LDLIAQARVFDGTRFLDGPHDVLVEDGRAVEVAPRIEASAGRRLEGGVVFPGFVDAHVHLAFSSAAEILARGVTAVLDLGAPANIAFGSHAPLLVRAAGPLLTAVSGYPTRSWGANGFGLEIASEDDARHAVALLVDRGAAAVKVAIEPAGGPLLADEFLRIIADASHASGLKVFAHALDARSVTTALSVGVDVLAHTPIEKLSDSLVAEIASRGVGVISTLRAFDARRAARRNLAAFADAGCALYYGTDLGNGDIRPGIDAGEIALLAEGLGSEAAALAAATTGAAGLIGLNGALGGETGVVRFEKYSGPADLAGPMEVWMNA